MDLAGRVLYLSVAKTRRRPALRLAVLVHDQRFGISRQNLERFQEFDDAVALVGRARVEGLPLSKRLSAVGFDGLPGRGELPVVHERAALIVEAPELAGDELAVARKERLRAGRLILVERLAFRIGLRIAGGTDIVQLEI